MIIDIVIALIVLIAFFYGYSKGFIHSVVWLLTIFIGIIAALYLSKIVAVYFDKWFHIDSKYLPIISFIAVFIGIFILFKLAEGIIEKVFDLLHINLLNKLAGALVWSFTFTLICSTFLFYGTNMQLLKKDLIDKSIVYPIIEPMAPDIVAKIGLIIPPIKNVFNATEDWFKNLEIKNNSHN